MVNTRIHKLENDLCIDCRKSRRVVQFQYEKHGYAGGPTETEIVNDRTKRCRPCYLKYASKLFEQLERAKEEEAQKRKQELLQEGIDKSEPFLAGNQATCVVCDHKLEEGTRCWSCNAPNSNVWCLDCVPLQA